MERVVILGSGLSGLISSYRIKNSRYADSVKVYERNPHISKRNSTAAFYGHQFFNEELTPESFEVHWKVNTKLESKEEYRKAYARKVYGADYSGKVSIKDGEAKGYGINTDALIKHADIQYNYTATNINTEHRVVTFNDGEKVPYDTLVCTLPMPLFLLLSSDSGRDSYIFKCEPIYYSVIKRIGREADYNHMHLDYFPDDDVPYYRKTTWGDKITIESMKEFDGSVAANPGMMWDSDGVKELRARLTNKGVYFQGRYARWERKDLTHMVWNRIIKDIYE